MKIKCMFLINKVLLVLFTILLSLLICEGLMRIFGLIQGVDYRLFSVVLTNSDRLPDVMYNKGPSPLKPNLKPNINVVSSTADYSVVYSINSKGFRDKEYSYERNAKKRLIVIGDSFTFGEGIPYGKRFSDIAEEMLEKTEIINMGVPGMGLDVLAMYLLQEGLKYRPDAVVIAMNSLVTDRGGQNYKHIFTEASQSANLERNYTSENYYSSDSISLSKEEMVFQQQTNNLVKWSYLLSYINYVFQKKYLLSKLQSNDKSVWEIVENVQKQRSSDDFVKNQNLLERNYFILHNLCEILSTRNVQCIFLNIDNEPLKNISKELFSLYPYYDFHTELVEYEKTSPLTFQYDRHYNVQTNNLLGNLLGKTLIKAGW